MDPDVQAFVEKLERTADEEEGRPDPSQLPSGDVLAREFQRFLRQRGNPPSLRHVCHSGYISRMASTAFEVLGEPRRREILDLLRAGERPVGELVDRVALSQPAVSKHLKVLREAGLVDVRQDAQRRLYRLRPGPLAEVDAWLAPYRELWSASLDALERRLDGDAMTGWAALEERGGGAVLRFERRLAHPPEKVFRAISDPDELRHWFPATVELELRAGAPIRFAFEAGDDGHAGRRGARGRPAAAPPLHVGRRRARLGDRARGRRLPAGVHARAGARRHVGRAARERAQRGGLGRVPRARCARGSTAVPPPSRRGSRCSRATPSGSGSARAA